MVLVANWMRMRRLIRGGRCVTSSVSGCRNRCAAPGWIRGYVEPWRLLDWPWLLLLLR